jgi:hypothetical protein
MQGRARCSTAIRPRLHQLLAGPARSDRRQPSHAIVAFDAFSDHELQLSAADRFRGDDLQHPGITMSGE